MVRSFSRLRTEPQLTQGRRPRGAGTGAWASFNRSRSIAQPLSMRRSSTVLTTLYPRRERRPNAGLSGAALMSSQRDSMSLSLMHR